MAGLKLYKTPEEQRRARRDNMRRYRAKKRANKNPINLGNINKRQLYAHRKLGIMVKIRKHFSRNIVPLLNEDLKYLLRPLNNQINFEPINHVIECIKSSLDRGTFYLNNIEIPRDDGLPPPMA